MTYEGAAYAVTKHLDITEIAKRIRVNLRNAQQMGALPAGMTFSVRIDRYSGGQAIDVDLTGMPDTWTYNEPGRQADYCNNIPAHGGYTQAAQAAKQLVKGMLDSYNRDNSDIMTDYFDVHFYGDVVIHDEARQRFEAEQRAVKAAQRKAAAERKAAGLPTRGRAARSAAGRVARAVSAELRQR